MWERVVKASSSVPLLMVLLVVVVGGFVVAAAHNQESHPRHNVSPIEKLAGQYGDFSIVSSGNNDMVFVTIATLPPQEYLHAMKKAWDLAEEKTGRKVSAMSGGASLTSVVLHLEDKKK